MTRLRTAPAAAHPTADALALLGLAAEFEFEAFVRLAGDAAEAPSYTQRQEIARASRHAVEREERLVARIVELGGDPAETMAPFDGIVADFELRTTAGDWWERLLKAYVGYELADDFLRLLARGTDPGTRHLVDQLLDDPTHSDLVVRELSAALADDGVLASRLALWGRRLVGDALGVMQGLVARYPALTRLLDASSEQAVGDEDRITRLFALLTAEHTRRMERLGLTP